MRTHLRSLFFTLFFALLATAVAVSPARAQTAEGARPVMDSLSTLPEAEMIVYLNAPRIVNEAIPRFTSPKQNQDMQDAIAQIKALTGVDLKRMEFIIAATRFNKPSGGVLFPLPQALIVTRGDFDAKALIGMGMMMVGGKLHEEQYGSHSLSVLNMEEVQPGMSKTPYGAAYAEMAITALDPNTLAIGNAAYVRAALDAADGRGRIKPEILASLMRDPTALISIAGSPLMAFAKSFGLRAAENNGECMTHFGEFYGAVNMDTQSFKVSGAMHADNPDTAVIIKNMLAGVAEMAKSSAPDKNLKTMVDEVKLVAEGSEVLIQATIPQEVVTKYITDMFAPPPPPPPTRPVMIEATATQPEKAVKPKPKGKRSRRKK